VAGFISDGDQREHTRGLVVSLFGFFHDVPVHRRGSGDQAGIGFVFIEAHEARSHVHIKVADSLVAVADAQPPVVGPLKLVAFDPPSVPMFFFVSLLLLLFESGQQRADCCLCCCWTARGCQTEILGLGLCA
jgi:hypothetical protein